MANIESESYSYWRDREIEHAKSTLKDENKVVQAINDAYRGASREIEKEMQSMLDKYASDTGLSQADVKRQVEKEDIRDYEDKAKKYVKEKNFSNKANKEMKRYNLKMKVSRLQLLKAHIGMELNALTNEVEGMTYDQLLNVGYNEMKRQAGILGNVLKISDKAIEYIVTRKFHDRDFSNNLWHNKKLLHAKLNDRLVEQITKGQNPRKAARILRKDIASSVYNSERLMRTESARVQSEIQMESFKEFDFKEYEFIVTEGACDICEPLDGEIFKVSEATPGENMSPMHPHCRCSQASYMSRKEWEEHLENQK